ncbi:unnamed protein product [Caenorhabditis nigoni]
MPGRQFTLKYEFNDVGELETNQNRYSPAEEYFGTEWSLGINKGENNLGIHIHTDVGKNEDICADYTIKIVSKNKKNTCSMSTSCVFTYDQEHQGCPGFFYWDTLEDEYLDDGKLEVMAHVKITKIRYFGKESGRNELRSFGEDMKQFSDVILRIDEDQFYVSKLYLSAQSPYFATLFLGKFQEAEKSEIELQDVDSESFQCYLEVLYGENGIDDNTVQGVLSVANMFNTPLVVKKCEEFLVEKSKKGLKRKLEFAGNYRMEGLKKQCLDEIKSKKDILSVIPADPMEMDHDVAVKLLQKSLDFN